MKNKPYACFGHVLLSNTYDTTEKYFVNKTNENNDRVLAVSGHAQMYNEDTGEFCEDVFPGWFVSSRNYEDTRYEFRIVEETTTFCYSAKLNQDYVPEIAPLVLEAGESQMLAPKTKLFLCKGTIDVDGRELVGPCQVLNATDKTLVAKTPVYGMIFS
jgi:hypothetical protein